MKRSEVNAITRDAEAFLKERRFFLPPFSHWSLDEWRERRADTGEIVARGLGWDITDFGQGSYASKGLSMFTIRNGDPENLKTCQGKVYAEKILIVDVDQITPFHFHWVKIEDIINRGGGELLVQLYNSTDDDGLAGSDVIANIDGIEKTVPAGATVSLRPGESITLPPRLYHQFWARGRRVLVGEVSLVNDDHSDNRFYEHLGRFPMIEEDEEPYRLLVGDYESRLTR